jgi:hypothetical protein
VCPRSRLPDAPRQPSRHNRIDARKSLSQKAKHDAQLEWMTDGR